MKISPFILETKDYQEKVNQLPEKKKSIKVSTKKKMNKNPSAFSFSQIQTFEKCPRQYEYIYIKKYPTKTHPALIFGTIIHATLKDFFEKLAEERKNATFLPADEDYLLKIFKNKWSNIGFLSKEHAQKMRAKGQNLLHNFYQKHQGIFPKTIALEKSFEIELDKFKIRGKIDRIDDLGNREGKVIDYKTGQEKTQKEVDKNWQLSLYALACQNSLNIEPRELSLYFLDSGQEIITFRSGEDLDKIKVELVKKMEKIYESDFAPTAGFICQRCDFSDICDAAKKESKI